MQGGITTSASISINTLILCSAFNMDVVSAGENTFHTK